MQATGIEDCSGCGTKFPRGSQMNAVAYVDGTPLGWICDECIFQWRHTGNPPAGLLKDAPDKETGGHADG
jgi:ribosomal protein L37AE/L43A